MSEFHSDKVFASSVPALYESHMVPLIFGPYAVDMADRMASRSVSRVLEVAAGTGVLTRALARRLAAGVEIVATDLNQPMLDEAMARGTPRPVEWRQADAQQLPFPDASFDAVVCQFGAMFFPSKPAAFAQARRVLRPGGVFLFSVWDKLADNEFADEVTAALASFFPDDPPRFMARTPHGYHDRLAIGRDLAGGGFTAAATFDVVTARSRAQSPDVAALAYCQGTPLRNEIEARDPSGLAQATSAVASAIAARFGAGTVDGKIQALVVAVER